MKELGIIFPGWLLSWPMIFIALGLIILIKHKFQSGFGFFMLLFGTFFLLKTEFNLPIDIGKYVIPVGLILLGLYIILNRRNNNPNNRNELEDKERTLNRGFFYGGGNPKDKDSSEKHPSDKGPWGKASTAFYKDQGDFLSSQAFFCGVQKRVRSKSFKGGKVSVIFGGSEIDLRQSDLAEHAFLDVEIAFGGLKLIVPPHWDLQIDVTNVFAGIEDKRMYPQTTPDPSKVLRIKGTVVFGSLEIKSF